MYNLIDIAEDTGVRTVLETAPTEAEVLRFTVFDPSDCLEGAETWQDVVDAAEGYDGGLLDLVEGYVVEEAILT